MPPPSPAPSPPSQPNPLGHEVGGGSEWRRVFLEGAVKTNRAFAHFVASCEAAQVAAERADNPLKKLHGVKVALAAVHQCGGELIVGQDSGVALSALRSLLAERSNGIVPDTITLRLGRDNVILFLGRLGISLERAARPHIEALVDPVEELRRHEKQFQQHCELIAAECPELLSFAADFSAGLEALSSHDPNAAKMLAQQCETATIFARVRHAELRATQRSELLKHDLAVRDPDVVKRESLRRLLTEGAGADLLRLCDVSVRLANTTSTELVAYRNELATTLTCRLLRDDIMATARHLVEEHVVDEMVMWPVWDFLHPYIVRREAALASIEQGLGLKPAEVISLNGAIDLKLDVVTQITATMPEFAAASRAVFAARKALVLGELAVFTKYCEELAAYLRASADVRRIPTFDPSTEPRQFASSEALRIKLGEVEVIRREPQRQLNLEYGAAVTRVRALLKPLIGLDRSDELGAIVLVQTAIDPHEGLPTETFVATVMQRCRHRLEAIQRELSRLDAEGMVIDAGGIVRAASPAQSNLLSIERRNILHLLDELRIAWRAIRDRIEPTVVTTADDTNLSTDATSGAEEPSPTLNFHDYCTASLACLEAAEALVAARATFQAVPSATAKAEQLIAVLRGTVDSSDPELTEFLKRFATESAALARQRQDRRLFIGRRKGPLKPLAFPEHVITAWTQERVLAPRAAAMAPVIHFLYTYPPVVRALKRIDADTIKAVPSLKHIGEALSDLAGRVQRFEKSTQWVNSLVIDSGELSHIRSLVLGLEQSGAAGTSQPGEVAS